jgi:hypothetical protein
VSKRGVSTVAAIAMVPNGDGAKPRQRPRGAFPAPFRSGTQSAAVRNRDGAASGVRRDRRVEAVVAEARALLAELEEARDEIRRLVHRDKQAGGTREPTSRRERTSFTECGASSGSWT